MKSLGPGGLLEKRLGRSARGDDVFRLYGLARYSRAKLFVEVGVQVGASTTALLLAAQENGGRLVSIDIDASWGQIYQGHEWWTFICGDSREPALPQKAHIDAVEFLFVDTSHLFPDTT